jgi:ketosteroid isomerase-like protein
LALILTGTAAACTSLPSTPVSDPHAADRDAIRNARLAQNEAIAVADLDGIAAFWTDDVQARPGLGPPIAGRAAYRRAFAGDAPGEVFVRAPVSIEVSEHWPLAFETGAWSWHLAGSQSPPIVIGRYSAQWVRRDGRWLIRAEVFVPLSCEAAGCSYPHTP